MTSEPWCWHPDQIARLTDWQITNIIRAQDRRVERMERQTAGAAAPPAGPAPPPGQPPPRELLVRDMMGLGMSRAQAEAKYDRQLEAFRAGRG